MDRGEGYSGVDYGVDSAKILFWPEGSVNLVCLERLLAKAHGRKLSPESKLGFFRHVRRDNADSDGDNYPNYDNVHETMSVSALNKLYEDVARVEFDPTPGTSSSSVYAIMFNTRTGESFLVDIGS